MRGKNHLLDKEPKELQRIATLKEKLLGTDREDHWEEVLQMEKEIKEALVKKDLTKHHGMRLLLEWMVQRLNQGNELLLSAKSKRLSESERDALIEVNEFIRSVIAFLDPSGKRLKEINKELDVQLEEEEDEILEASAEDEA